MILVLPVVEKVPLFVFCPFVFPLLLLSNVFLSSPSILLFVFISPLSDPSIHLGSARPSLSQHPPPKLKLKLVYSPF